MPDIPSHRSRGNGIIIGVMKRSAMHWSFLLLCMLVGGAVAGSEPPKRPFLGSSDCFPGAWRTWEGHAEWESVEQALKQAGYRQPVLTICPRMTQVVTAHVVLESTADQPQMRAIVGPDRTGWSILCITGELDGCQDYGGLPNPQQLGWKAPDVQRIAGPTWEWVSDELFEEVPHPGRYTIQFRENGRFEAQFNCNTGGGSYEISAGAISFREVFSTSRDCPPDSLDKRPLCSSGSLSYGPSTPVECSPGLLALLDARLLGDLDWVEWYFVQNGDLYLGTQTRGTVRLRPRAPNAHGTPSPGQIANASFTGILPEPVTLTDGRYEGPPVVTLLPAPSAFGDLDGDGDDEEVVLLVSEEGEKGAFLHLAAVALQDGRAVNLATARVTTYLYPPLGDRFQTRSLAVVPGGVIRLEVFAPAPEDPICCPTETSISAWTLRGGRLVSAAPAIPPAR